MKFSTNTEGQKIGVSHESVHDGVDLHVKSTYFNTYMNTSEEDETEDAGGESETKNEGQEGTGQKEPEQTYVKRKGKLLRDGLDDIDRKLLNVVDFDECRIKCDSDESCVAFSHLSDPSMQVSECLIYSTNTNGTKIGVSHEKEYGDAFDLYVKSAYFEATPAVDENACPSPNHSLTDNQPCESACEWYGKTPTGTTGATWPGAIRLTQRVDRTSLGTTAFPI